MRKRGQPVPSGLPTGSARPKNIQRLEKSRAWLKDYHHRKEVTNAERGSDHVEELQASGRSVEDVREAEPGASA